MSASAQPPARRVVLDSNVVLSAVLFRQGRLSPLRLAWQAGQIVPVVCRTTLEEFTHLLGYSKFRLSPQDRADALAMYLPYIETHTLPDPLPPSIWLPCRDARDQIFLDLAQSARVDVLVSGDQDLLALDGSAAASSSPCRILTPAAFLDLLHAP